MTFSFLPTPGQSLIVNVIQPQFQAYLNSQQLECHYGSITQRKNTDASFPRGQLSKPNLVQTYAICLRQARSHMHL